MRRSFALPSAALLTTCVFATPAYADDAVDQAIAELSSSNVYVEEGMPGTTKQTEPQLLKLLRQDDGIILVMISESNEPIDQIAEQIDDATGNDSVIGLVVGQEVIGHSEVLPDGVAANLMDRAEIVATSPVETLSTFTRTTHTYEMQNPDLFNPPEPAGPAGDSGGMPIWPLALVGAIIVAAATVAIRKMLDRGKHNDALVLQASPSNVRDLLNEIRRITPQITNEHVQATLLTIIGDTEAFFRRSKKSEGRDTDKEAIAFQRKLEDTIKMLTRYVDIQNNPRYYDEPRQLLASGVEAVDGLSTGILKSVRSRNTRALLDYRASSDILSAERY